MPSRITKATATQNSGSKIIVISLSFQDVGYSFGDSLVGRCGPDEPLDNSFGGIAGDGADVRHGGLFGVGNCLFRLGQPGIEFVLERLALGSRFGGLPLTRLVGDCMRATAGVGQCLFVVGERFIGLGLEPSGFGEVVSDAVFSR